jgi:ATP-binding cassette, subfamily B, bacterial MsbA
VTDSSGIESKPQRAWPLLRRLVGSYLRPYRWRVVFALSMAALEAAATSGIALALEKLLDDILQPQNGQWLWPFAGAVFLIFLLRGMTAYLHAVTMNAVGQRVVATIQQGVFGHLMQADLAYIQGQATGQLISRLVSDVNQMRAAVVECVSGFIRQGLTLIMLVGVMFWQDWRLACIAFAILPGAAWFLSNLGRRLRRVATRTQEQIGVFASVLNETLQGARHVKAYGMEAGELARVGGIVDRLRRLSVKSFRISASLLPINETFSGLVVVAVIVYGGYGIAQQTMTAGELVSFIGAFMLAYQPMNALTKLNAQLQIGLAAAQRVLEVLDVKPLITDRPDARPLPAGVPEIQLQQVSFSYARNITPVLDRLNLTVPAGRTVALVGVSGAGKSTILNLIPRFYDVTAGQVMVGGSDVRDVTIASLRAAMAIVSQESALFDDTIRANIAYGRPGASPAQIEQAARDAAAHDFIMAQPLGYETLVGENGTALSGGQRQRIAIARAMLKDAPILLLDEATSALDSESERAVQDALKRLQQGRTTIVIAHRLSTIVEADCIYVLDQGRVVEYGAHASLLGNGGPYSRFHALQSAGAALAGVAIAGERG